MNVCYGCGGCCITPLAGSPRAGACQMDGGQADRQDVSTPKPKPSVPVWRRTLYFAHTLMSSAVLGELRYLESVTSGAIHTDLYESMTVCSMKWPYTTSQQLRRENVQASRTPHQGIRL